VHFQPQAFNEVLKGYCQKPITFILESIKQVFKNETHHQEEKKYYWSY